MLVLLSIMDDNYCNNIINKKNLVITEILETEESYVNHLKEIVEVSLLSINLRSSHRFKYSVS